MTTTVAHTTHAILLLDVFSLTQPTMMEMLALTTSVTPKMEITLHPYLAHVCSNINTSSSPLQANCLIETDRCQTPSCNPDSGCVYTAVNCTDSDPCTIDSCSSRSGNHFNLDNIVICPTIFTNLPRMRAHC